MMTPTTPAPMSLNSPIQFELNRAGANLRTPLAAGVGGDESFSDYLALARNTFNSNGAGGADEELNTEEDVVRAAARELVATAFFEPLFKLMREDPLRAEVVPLSAGEKMFGPMLHSEFAKQITAKGKFPLVNAIVRSLLPGTGAVQNNITTINTKTTIPARGLEPELKQPQRREGMVDIHG